MRSFDISYIMPVVKISRMCNYSKKVVTELFVCIRFLENMKIPDIRREYASLILRREVAFFNNTDQGTINKIPQNTWYKTNNRTTAIQLKTVKRVISGAPDVCFSILWLNHNFALYSIVQTKLPLLVASNYLLVHAVSTNKQNIRIICATQWRLTRQSYK